MTPGPYSIGGTIWPGLAKLAEECGEVVQVIGKIIALNGAENYDHWDGTNLLERLQEEMADLYAALAFVRAHNPVDGPALVRRCMVKLDWFKDWHKEVADDAAP